MALPIVHRRCRARETRRCGVNAPALSTIVDTLHVSDRIRHKALYCGYDAPLIVREVYQNGVQAKLIKPGMFQPDQLIAISDQLGLGVSKSMIYRGLTRPDLGAGVFFSKLDGLFLTRSGKANFENKAPGRQAEAYKVRPWIDVEQSLDRAVLITGKRNHYPAGVKDELLADLDDVTIESLSLSIGKGQSEIQNVIDDYKTAYHMQDELAVRRAFKDVRRDVKALNAVSDGSTPMLPGWFNGARYRAILFRAKYEAAPNERLSYKDITRLYGIARSSVPALLKRAGLRNIPSSMDLLDQPLDQNQDTDKQIEKLEFEHRGKVYETKWDEHGIAVAVSLHIPGLKEVIGPVAPPKPKRDRKITNDDHDGQTGSLDPKGSKTTQDRQHKQHPPRRSLNAQWFEKKLELVHKMLDGHPIAALVIGTSTAIVPIPQPQPVNPPKPLPRPTPVPDDGKWSTADKDEFLASRAAFEELDHETV